MKPGAMKLYFATSDVATAHEELDGKGVKVSEIKDNYYGPGSDVKWFDFEDPDGNQVLFAQEQTPCKDQSLNQKICIQSNN